MKHTCHVPHCEVVVPSKQLMCGRHWRMVPAPMQKAVWRYYRPGQEIDKKPSLQWDAAANAAIKFVVQLEKRSQNGK